MAVVGLFGGQGCPSGSLRELRRVTAGHRPTARLVASISGWLAEELASPAAAPHLPLYRHGLDLTVWAAQEAPELELAYLNSPAVAFPLLFAIQLACFSYCGAQLAGALGHSSGLLAAAAALRLADGERAVRPLVQAAFWVGLRVSERCAQQLWAGRECAVAVVGCGQQTVEQLVEQHNSAGHELITLAARNAPDAWLLAGSPEAVAVVGSAAKAVGRVRRCPIMAPYHTRWLEELPDIVVNDLAGRGVEIGQLPAGLATAGVTGPRELLAAVLVEPVDWPSAVQAAVERWPDVPMVDFGTGGGSGALNMTRRVVRPGRRPRLAYFSQEFCVPGPLPGSWLEWVGGREPVGDRVTSSDDLWYNRSQ